MFTPMRVIVNTSLSRLQCVAGTKDAQKKAAVENALMRFTNGGIAY
jgi:hypothetical protein